MRTERLRSSPVVWQLNKLTEEAGCTHVLVPSHVCSRAGFWVTLDGCQDGAARLSSPLCTHARVPLAVGVASWVSVWVIWAEVSKFKVN